MATDHNFRVKNGLEVGGVLIVNSSGQLQAVTATSNLSFDDNVKAQFGAGNDLQIYHDPHNSFILHNNSNGYFAIKNETGSLFLHGNRVDLRTSTGNESMLRAFLNGAVELYHDNSLKLITHSSGIDVTGEIHLDDSNTKLLKADTTTNRVRVQTNHGYLDIGPGNSGFNHFITDRAINYFNKGIQVDEGIVTSYDEDLKLSRANNTADGQVRVERGRFRGESQSATDLLNSSMVLGGFHANSAFEEAYGHFYIPGLSPNNLAGAHRRLTVTVKKNGTTQSGDFSKMFSADGTNTSFSHAAGSTDTIEITITGCAMSYGQHVGVQFGHPTFRAKDIEIEVSTDNGSNWTSVYDVTNFPHATVSHYHGGSGTQTNGIRFTFTNFNNTGMRINQLFCYDYSENEIYFAEKNQDQLIRGDWTWLDNYEAKFGNSGDLQIYHNGTHSYIDDAGTGDLRVKSNFFRLRDAGDTYNYLTAAAGGAVTLYHNGNTKLATTSGGIDITGTTEDDHFATTTNVNSTGDGGLRIFNGKRLGFDESGVRSWTMKAASGNLNVYSGDGSGTFDTSGVAAAKVGNLTIGKSGSYASFDNWIAMNNIGFYTTTRINIDLDDSSSIFAVRGTSNQDLFYVRTDDNDVHVTNDLHVGGDLNVTGDINSVSVTDLDVTDKTITVGVGQTAGNSGDSGLIVAGSNKSLLWKQNTTEWAFNDDLHVGGALSWTGVGTGNGSGISSLNASNLSTGTVPIGRIPTQVVQTAQTLVREETYTGSTNYGTNNTWHTLYTLNENASPVLMYLKSSAHSSALVSISRGYFGNNTANINVLNSTYTQNGSYPGVTEIRVVKNSSNAYLVQVKLSWTASSVAGFALYVRLIGATEASAVPSLNSTIPTDSTSHTQVAHVYTNSTYSSFSTTPRVSNNVIWHAGNDGASSGLDADTVDGQHLGTTAAATFDHLNLGGASGDGGEDLKVGGIRGNFSGEHIQLYRKVGIGYPSGWNGDNSSTPDFGIATYGGANLAYNQGVVTITTGSIGASTTNRGLLFDGNYTNGQYRHRWRKHDKGGGVPLYLDNSEGTANSYTEQVRFGSYTGASHKFEVYGNAKVDNLDVSSEGSTSQIVLGKYDSTDQGILYLTGSTANKQSVLKTTNGNLHIDSNAGNNTYINYYTGNGTAFGTGAGGIAAWMGSDGDLWKGSADNTGSKYWHAGNDGASSGLDADLLDGLQSTSFLRSDASDTFNSTSASNTITFETKSGELISDGGNNTNFPLQIYAPASTDAAMTFHVGNDYAFYFGLDHVTNDLSYGGWSIGSSKNKVWTARNDGAGSGLDADLLDGQQGAAYKRNNETGSSAEYGPWYSTGAYVYDGTNGTRYFWNLLGTIAASSCRGTIEYEAKDDENYPSFVRGLITFSGFNSGSSFSIQHDQSTQDPFGVQVRVDTSRRIWIRTPNVDWAHYFRFRVHNQSGNFTTNTSWSTGSTRYDTLSTSVPPNSSSDIMSGQNLRATSSSVTGTVPSYSNFNYFGKVYARESMSVAGSTVYHTGNDGSGSGLDADTVDGVQLANLARKDVAQVFGVDTSSNVQNVSNYFRRNNTSNYTNAPLLVESYGGASTTTGVGFHISGQVGRYLYMNNAGNLYWNDSSSKIWNASNDGSGSGLDADTVDGVQPSAMSVNSANQSHMVTGSAFATTSSPSSVLEYQQASSLTDTKLAPSGDWHNTIRLGHGNPYSYYSNTIALRMTGSGLGDLYTQTISNNNAQGWNKHWHNNNDGSGSGLDADLLDGQHASAFAPVGGSSTFRPVTAGLYGIGHGSSTLPIWQYNSGNTGYGIAYTESSPDVLRFDVSGNLMSGTADLELRPNELKVNNGLVWHSGNDGSGSGLDADNLDGVTWADRTKVVGATYIAIHADNGRGIGFWNNASGLAGSYAIAMSAHNGTGAGRVSGETTSDYNMYFKMSAGTNRGFVFKNSSTSVGGLDGAGNWRHIGKLESGQSAYLNQSGTNTTSYNTTHTHVIRSQGNNGNGGGLLIQNDRGNHSWGVVAEMRINTSGDSDNPTLLFSSAAETTNTWGIGYGYTDTNFRINRDHGHRNSNWGVAMMTLDRSGNATFAGNVTAYSDVRLKENIETIPDAVETVKKIRGVTFDWKESGEEGMGVIAQEIEEVPILQRLVSETPIDGASEFAQKNVAYGNMVGLLIEAIKEQQESIESQQEVINRLENEINNLKKEK